MLNDNDIISLCETKIDSFVSINTDNFLVNRCDRNNRGGGVTTFIADKLKPKIIDSLNQMAIDAKIEATFTSISSGTKKDKAVVIGIYRPPNAPVSWFEEVANLIIHASSIGNIILMGDLNADLFRSELTCTKHVMELISLVGADHSKLTIPTRITDKTSTCLDIIACSVAIRSSGYQVLNISASDHFPVKLNISTSINKLKPIHRKNFKHVNPDELKYRISEINISNDFETSPDDLLEEWHNQVIAILDDVAPVKPVPMRKHKCQWMTSDIKDLIKKRDFLANQSKSVGLSHLEKNKDLH